MKRPETNQDQRCGEAGFTLIEALTAMVILMFGVAAVANLMVVAGSSNTAANHGTAATAVGTQHMERIKAVPFGNLPNATSGSLTADVGPGGDCNGLDMTPAMTTFHCDAEVPGVGLVHVRWRVATLPAAANTRYIELTAESVSPIVRQRTRAWFTTFRTL